MFRYALLLAFLLNIVDENFTQTLNVAEKSNSFYLPMIMTKPKLSITKWQVLKVIIDERRSKISRRMRKNADKKLNFI